MSAALRLIAALLFCHFGTSLSAMRMLVGTYTPQNGKSEGIYLVDLNEVDGSLSQPTLAAACSHPTFLALSSDGRLVLATSELETGDNQRTAGVRTFAWDAAASELRPKGSLPVAAKGSSTHVALARDASTAFAVHYNAGWVASIALSASGQPLSVVSLVHQEGELGPARSRQDRPHAHSITLSPEGRHAYVCDLGTDQIVPYEISAADGSLRPLPAVRTEPGAGPRHSKCTPDGLFLYVVNELAGSLGVYSRDPSGGALVRLQTVSMLPPGFAGENTSAEVQLHPNGRFVYGSNRGPDLLTVMERDNQGLLRVVQRISCGGRHPRHFALSPDGCWLVCANRDSDSLVVFSVDAATGLLTPTGFSAVVPQAVCVLFAP